MAPLFISATVEASNFKFGIQVVFFSAVLPHNVCSALYEHNVFSVTFLRFLLIKKFSNVTYGLFISQSHASCDSTCGAETQSVMQTYKNSLAFLPVPTKCRLYSICTGAERTRPIHDYSIVLKAACNGPD